MDVLGSRSSGTLGTPSVLSAQKNTTEPNDVFSNFIQQIMDEHLPCALGCGDSSRKQCKCSLWPQGDIPVCSEQMDVQCNSHSVSHKTQQEAREKVSGSSVWREVKVKDAKVCVHHPRLLPPFKKEGQFLYWWFLRYEMAFLGISDFTVVKKGSTRQV